MKVNQNYEKGVFQWQRIMVKLGLIVLMMFVSGARIKAETNMINLPAGAVITMNGLKFVKLRNDPVKGAQFMALQAAPLMPYTGTMQAFTTAMCNNYPTPTGTNYTYVGIMTDSRDSKQYEVRKFADGKCWMVNNLAFGSNCYKLGFAGSDTTGTGTTGSSRQNVQAGYYGDCRYPYTTLATSDLSNKYGYLYDLVAATQNVSAYFGSNYQPTQPTQGICPTGWSLPTGGASGQFQALYVAAGSPATGFFQPSSGNWRGVYSGYCNSSGTLSGQGTNGWIWSSTQYTAGYNAILNFNSSGVDTNSNAILNKATGLAVRCVKN